MVVAGKVSMVSPAMVSPFSETMRPETFAFGFALLPVFALVSMVSMVSGVGFSPGRCSGAFFSQPSAVARLRTAGADTGSSISATSQV